jgi:hypothetical protein
VPNTVQRGDIAHRWSIRHAPFKGLCQRELVKLGLTAALSKPSSVKNVKLRTLKKKYAVNYFKEEE